MATLHKIKLLLAVVIAFRRRGRLYFCLVVERQDALEQVSRYNVAWLVSQAATEYARLEQRVSAFGMPGGGVTADEVQLRFDIIINRMQAARAPARSRISSTGHGSPRDRDQGAACQSSRAAAGRQDRPSPATRQQSRNCCTRSTPETCAPCRGRQPLGRRPRRRRPAPADDAALAVLRARGRLDPLRPRADTRLFWHNSLLKRAHMDLHGLADQLGTQNERFDAALNNMSQALCMVDGEQRLIVCNQRFRELFELASGVVQPGT